MPEMFPIFVGITGKRSFSSDPGAAANSEQDVRKRLARAFGYIDRQLPDTPKVLLTGAAIGADLIAAEEALFPSSDIRPAAASWLVVAALPFERRLFEQDFTPEEWNRFQRIINDARTLEWVLPNLKAAGDNRPFQASDLERKPGASEFQKDIRRRHYEQVGLWIADRANVLIGVMSAAEKADRIGGTARIVACRRGGRPDRVAAQVIAASHVLSPQPELHRPPRGHVWLIDPAAPPLPQEPGVTVLAPASDFTPWHLAYETPGGALTQDHLAAHVGELPTQERLLEDSVKLFDVARGYAAESQVAPAEMSWTTLRAATVGQSAALVLDRLAGELKPYAPAERYRRVIHRVVSWFLLAVLAFEVFAKFLHEEPLALSVYLIVLLLVIGTYFFAELGNLQAAAEDRRAMREALRVQAAWWQGGLADRVDHVYLRGADEDLARVLEGARNAIIWAELKCGGVGAPRWEAVYAPQTWKKFSFDMPVNQFPRDWIGNQLYYFRQRSEQRKAKGELFEAMSWELFATAAWLALLLLIWLFFTHAGPDQAENPTMFDAFHDWLNTLDVSRAAIATTCCVAGASVLWWAGVHPFARARVQWKKFLIPIGVALPAALLIFAAVVVSATIVDERSYPLMMLAISAAPAVAFAPYWALKLYPIARFAPRWLRDGYLDANRAHPVTTAFGLGAVIMLGFVLQAAAALYKKEDFDFADAATYMMIVYVIFLPALGGAMRFLSEKLAIEAEALSYRDAYCWFAHANDLLSSLRPGSGDVNAHADAQDIIRRLGTLALEENAAWLRSRRQRPLSPL